MAQRLSGKLKKLIHQMGREREDRIITSKTRLAVSQIFLMDGNWKIFREHREITGKPLRQEEIEKVENMVTPKVKTKNWQKCINYRHR